MTKKVISHEHNLTTQSLNNYLGIGQDHDVSNAANQKPTPQYQLGISLFVLSGMKLMSLETTNGLGKASAIV
jgi:hypothetical protein